MKILLVQNELVRDLISTNDATIIGVLLAVIALLIYHTHKLDKKIEKRDDYIREMDKSTLEILGNLTKHIQERSNQIKEQTETVVGVEKSVVDVKSKVEQILDIVRQKLLSMN